MKKWDYEITINHARKTGASRTITAKSDRAKRRTPEPQEFADNDGALAFVESGVAEGSLPARMCGVSVSTRDARGGIFWLRAKSP